MQPLIVQIPCTSRKMPLPTNLMSSLKQKLKNSGIGITLMERCYEAKIYVYIYSSLFIVKN